MRTEIVRPFSQRQAFDFVLIVRILRFSLESFGGDEHLVIPRKCVLHV
jgi:hypothetical protein